MSIAGKTFVITGAARGIGAATAAMAASRGAAVVLTDVLDSDGEAAAAEIRSAGGNAAYQHCDVSQTDQVEALMGWAAERFGSIDVLHNNAGIHESMLTHDTSLDTMSEATFDRVLAVNLKGAFLCAKYALPYLRQSRRGPSIVNAGSIASLVGFSPGIAYGAAKAGIALLTKNLAVDLARHGIRVNCYCPATIDTAMAANALEISPDPRAAMRTMVGTHLVHRIGKPEDVASLVCFLASDDASFVNGVVWLIDGGSLAWRGTVDVLGMS